MYGSEMKVGFPALKALAASIVVEVGTSMLLSSPRFTVSTIILTTGTIILVSVFVLVRADIINCENSWATAVHCDVSIRHFFGGAILPL